MSAAHENLGTQSFEQRGPRVRRAGRLSADDIADIRKAASEGEGDAGLKAISYDPRQPQGPKKIDKEWTWITFFDAERWCDRDPRERSRLWTARRALRLMLTRGESAEVAVLLRCYASPPPSLHAAVWGRDWEEVAPIAELTPAVERMRCELVEWRVAESLAANEGVALVSDAEVKRAIAEARNVAAARFEDAKLHLVRVRTPEWADKVVYDIARAEERLATAKEADAGSVDADHHAQAVAARELRLARRRLELLVHKRDHAVAEAERAVDRTHEALERFDRGVVEGARWGSNTSRTLPLVRAREEGAIRDGCNREVTRAAALTFALDLPKEKQRDEKPHAFKLRYRAARDRRKEFIEQNIKQCGALLSQASTAYISARSDVVRGVTS